MRPSVKESAQHGLCKRIISLAADHTGECPLKQSASHEPGQFERNTLFGIWTNVVNVQTRSQLRDVIRRIRNLERLVEPRRPPHHCDLFREADLLRETRAHIGGLLVRHMAPVEPLSRQSHARLRERRTWPYGFGHDSEDDARWKKKPISDSCQLRLDEHMSHTHKRY